LDNALGRRFVQSTIRFGALDEHRHISNLESTSV
jgi:hypothetical protein